MITFRPAITSEAKPLIGLYSESGCGKTYSALLLARGFAGNAPIGMIETEGGRGEAYADMIPGSYLVLPIRDGHSPGAYGDAIGAAEDAKLRALIIDSASHEWEGAGGVLSMAAKNQADGKKGVQVWQLPKMEHQRYFMGRLISTPIPLVIICMRAKYPMQEDKVKKEWVRSTVLEPTQSENILFEMFVHGWIDKEHKFHGTKYTRPDFREILVDGEPISIKTGQRLAAWAAGAKKPAATPAASAPAQPSAPTTTEAPADSTAALFGDVEAEQEAARLRTEIFRERDGWVRKPNDPDWKAVCRHWCGTDELDRVDVAQLTDFLVTLKKITAKDAATLKELTDVVTKARSAA